MDGIVIKRKEDYTNKAEQEAGYIGLLASINNVEISELFIRKDKMFLLVPGKDGLLNEFFYLLDGQIKEESGEFEINPGDSFYLNKIEKPIYCRATIDSKMLYLTNESVLHSMSQAIEKLHEMMTNIDNKDHYTKGHCVRVIEWAPKVAKAMKLDGNQLEILTYAALFHDLGKIEISDEILHKPSSLSLEEFASIKNHPTIGKGIADSYQLEEIGQVIEQHHERLDGSGYPYGLKGDEIRIEAKIIAVIDSYDAMTSDRPYRSGLSKEDAIEELIRCKDSYYDENIVDIFIDLLKDD